MRTIKELNLNDDFLFARVMTDKEICRKFLEKILNLSIKKIKLPIEQKTIDLDRISKGEPYSNLKMSYVIFICSFDPFDRGRHIILKMFAQKTTN